MSNICLLLRVATLSPTLPLLTDTGSSYLAFIWWPGASPPTLWNYHTSGMTLINHSNCSFKCWENVWVNPINSLLLALTYLFILLGSLHPHTERLGALVPLWTGQAVETWISVDAALRSTHFVANIRHHVTLGKGKTGSSECKQILHEWSTKHTFGLCT